MRKRVRFILAMSLIFMSGLSAPVVCAYQSPYSVQFAVPLPELCAIDRQLPRNDPRLESSVPYDKWYGRRVRRVFGAWGPTARHYPAIPDFQNIPAQWKRQRVLAVAYNMIGLPYQHHHIPDWNPPPSWPWKQVAYGRNSPGMDCSDFTSWVYNYGLGIRLHTGIAEQAHQTMLRGPGGNGTVQARIIRNDNGYDDLVSKLKTGDLLYIRSNRGNVSHVIMWVGEYGKSPDGTPLVIDCTGPEAHDCNGNQIPIGVQLRPFGKTTWYYRNFAHAHRIIGMPLE